MLKNWAFKPAINYLPIIIAIGVALGVADNALRTETNLVESIILHTLTSLCIGFPMVAIVINAKYIAANQSESYRIVLFGLVFALLGMIASEIEIAVRDTVFRHSGYQPFSGGGLYLFNAILSVILGFSIMNSLKAQRENRMKGENGGLMIDAASVAEVEDDVKRQEKQPSVAELTKIPVKKGAVIHLLPLDSLSMFEASDKYAFVYNNEGEKHLCDYSLAFLETRLPAVFVRIHRKYIVNVEQVSRIQPFDKKRYFIEFVSGNVPSVKSSAGYQDAVKKLIKI